MQPLLLKGTLIDFWPVDKKHSKLGRLLVLAKNSKINTLTMSFVSHWPTRDAVDLATLLSFRRQCDSLLFDGSIRTTTAPKSRERNPIWQFFLFSRVAFFIPLGSYYSTMAELFTVDRQFDCRNKLVDKTARLSPEQGKRKKKKGNFRCQSRSLALFGSQRAKARGYIPMHSLERW